MSTSLPTSGWPMEVARYSADTSQAVSAAGAPSEVAIGTSATAMIDELIGFRMAPSIIGDSSRRSKRSGGGA